MSITKPVPAATRPPAAVGMGPEQAAREATRYWWLGVVTGIAWLLAALVVLQFDAASVKTVGVIVGCMFLAAGVQQLVAAAIETRLRLLRGLFGLLFLICG